MTVDRSPARLSGTVAVGAAVVSVLASGLYSWPALLIGSASVVLISVGLLSGSRSKPTGGATGLCVAALVAGVQGAPTIFVLVGATAAIIAWDATTTAISVGAQLGRAANTRRIEAIHLTASVGVGTATAGSAYLIFETATANQPLSALVLLVVAAVLVLTTIQHNADVTSR